MRFTGRLKTPVIDFVTGKITAMIEINEKTFAEAYEELKDKFLSIDIKQYRKKRSLDANAYYWVLLGKWAKLLHLPNEEAHNMMLRAYGQPEIYEGKHVYITIPDTDEAEKKVNTRSDYHLKQTSQVREGNDGVMYRTYVLLRGSHTYDTAEMARLISGLQEACRDIGIPEAEIATPDEKALLKERYGIEL